MGTSVANLDVTQYVKVNSAPGSFILQAHRDTVRVAISNLKPAVGNTAFHELGGTEETVLPIQHTDSGIWVLAMTDRSKLSVTELGDIRPSFQKGAFGELTVAENTAIIQSAAQYGLGTKTRTLVSGAGATAGANSESLFYCSSGTTVSGFGSTFSRRSASYKAGQGLTAELTSVFDTPVDGNNQQAGMINATDVLAFGYQNTEFGIFHSYDGQQEIQELQVTTPAAGSENATVTIDGTPYTVPLTASSVEVNAAEICNSLGAEPGLALFECQAVGDTVVLRTILAASFPGAFAFSSATAQATWTQVAEGVSRTEDFIKQSDWNGVDVSNWVDFDGSPLPFDAKKGNVYKIQTQYLGFGNIFFYIENPTTGAIELVHTIGYANRNIKPSVSNPTFRVGWASGNRGGTTDVEVKGASYALFIEGKRVITERGHSQFKSKTNLGATPTNVLTIKNHEVYGTKVNLASVIPKTASVETDSTKGAVVQINVGAVVSGQPLFNYHDKEESIVIYDTAGTTVTNGENVDTIVLGPGGEKIIDLEPFNLELNPGESLTISISKFGGGTHDVSASVAWQEDI